jgi:hypothetical protein
MQTTLFVNFQERTRGGKTEWAWFLITAVEVAVTSSPTPQNTEIINSFNLIVVGTV